MVEPKAAKRSKGPLSLAELQKLATWQLVDHIQGLIEAGDTNGEEFENCQFVLYQRPPEKPTCAAVLSKFLTKATVRTKTAKVEKDKAVAPSNQEKEPEDNDEEDEEEEDEEDEDEEEEDDSGDQAEEDPASR